MSRIEKLQADLKAAQEAAKEHALAIAEGKIVVLPNGVEMSRHVGKKSGEEKTVRIVTGAGTEFVPFSKLSDPQKRAATTAHYRLIADAVDSVEMTRLMAPNTPTVDETTLLNALAALPPEKLAALLAAAR